MTKYITAKSPQKLSGIGLFTFLRTYSRRINPGDPESKIETFEQTLNRVVSACNTQLNCNFTDDENDELFDLMWDLKLSVGGRYLWQLGTKQVENRGLLSLQNCAGVKIDDPIKPFGWCMTLLMLGCGVGYTVLKEDIKDFPVVKDVSIKRDDTTDADFIVPDSRQGWVKLLEKTLKSYFYTGESFTYSCILVRPAGSLIKSFGGIASGPEFLVKGIDKICEILDNKKSQKVTTVDCLDIMNIIGEIVISGNVRRSAQIALGDVSDVEYLKAKDWSSGNIPNHRAFSNNSIICNDINDILDDDNLWKGYRGDGEPYGLINMNLMRKCGRIGDLQYEDPDVVIINPCAEITLNNYETCCLGEIYLANIKSKDEFLKCLEYSYKICKHGLRLPCLDSRETEHIVHKNSRIGIGLTGVMQCSEEQLSWISDGYIHLRDYDKMYSMTNGFPTSIKLTTIKPSGTLSLLGNVSPGAHPAFSEFYIRRIRVSTGSKLIDLARDHGYHVEHQIKFDGSIDISTDIISFPCKFPKHTKFADDMTAIDQLEVIKRLQKEWSDNSVSVTIYYRLHELDHIKSWLKDNYNDNIKSVSFLLHNDHGFKQAPLEAISEQEYNTMMSNVQEIKDYSSICGMIDDIDNIGETECSGGSCPVR